MTSAKATGFLINTQLQLGVDRDGKRLKPFQRFHERNIPRTRTTLTQFAFSLTPNFSWVWTEMANNLSRFNGFSNACPPTPTPAAAAKVSGFLTVYSRKNGIYMKINFVNTEHVHALIDLPTNLAIEQVVK